MRMKSLKQRICGEEGGILRSGAHHGVLERLIVKGARACGIHALLPIDRSHNFCDSDYIPWPEVSFLNNREKRVKHFPALENTSSSYFLVSFLAFL